MKLYRKTHYSTYKNSPKSSTFYSFICCSLARIIPILNSIANTYHPNPEYKSNYISYDELHTVLECGRMMVQILSKILYYINLNVFYSSFKSIHEIKLRAMYNNKHISNYFFHTNVGICP